MSQTPPTLTCEAHGDATRITCVDCDAPICPRCLVRTDVGYKCEACAQPAVGPEPGATAGTRLPGWARWPRWPIAAVVLGALLVVVAAFVVGRSGGSAPPATLDPVGAWEELPALAAIRGTTAAVVLDDGRVLAAGGGVGSIAVAATEVLDPDTGAWEQVAELGQARRGAAAVVLGDGRVLVAGGIGDNTLRDSAELYDPDTDTWTETGAMTTPRLTFTLTALPDGRALAVGGSTPGGQAGSGGGQTIRPSASAEVFDPATGEWEATGEMTAARFEHTATALPGGRVLVAGGLGGDAVDGTFAPLASVEVFDPAVGQFTTAAAMAEGRTNHVAVPLGDGTVVVAGGLGDGEPTQRALATAERYDPSGGGWARLPALRQGRAGATATVLADGRVLVVGGEAVQGGSRRSLATAELLDPDEPAWAPAGRMACARSEHAAVRLDDGRVVALAGDAAFPGDPPVAQGCVDAWSAPDN